MSCHAGLIVQGVKLPEQIAVLGISYAKAGIIAINILFDGLAQLKIGSMILPIHANL
ncbi:hypothetical protein D3C84_1038150 [compost metagenome]